VLTLLGPALVASSFGLYMITNVWLGRFRRIPWEFLALSALGGGISVAHALMAPSYSTALAALAGVALLAFLVWFFFSFSMYGEREDRPRVGDAFPAFRLPCSDGSIFDSVSTRGTRHLLIFYRGSW
jgi:hypothetical protein